MPALPLVTSVSAVKTHSRMNASQVPEDQDRQRVKETRESEAVPVANADGGSTKR